MDLGGNEPKMTRKDEVEVILEEASDTEIEKLDISDEEKMKPATEVTRTLEQISVEKSREAMLIQIEKELIEEHNKELDEAIKHGKAVVKHTQSLIEYMKKVKNINDRRLAIFKVKATP
ncbi:hypothetical protein JCGZ_15511 [Jatropha curcas]|uniref:Uncharacterized protein n=1 Tax=Jatropha curcas TaxID=180498 RepID=A0A067KGD0_JATCU|nr:hypothetical protein JCGZ_15511 [Jatropha curcas]